MADRATLKIFRGTAEQGEMVQYTVDLVPGMVVLDAIHVVQAKDDSQLAVRWNCKAGKCGSCGGEVNGKPKLLCMDRMDRYPAGETIEIRPMKTFPLVKDLVTDVSWNYSVNKKIPAYKPNTTDDPRFVQRDADRVQEFRKCIECYLCQDVCHVLREHKLQDEFAGPRFFIRAATLEMHPLDDGDRIDLLRGELGLGYCNITKCCTEVCPESIAITDNAIIPLKERVVDKYYDPLRIIFRAIFGPG